MGSFDTAVKDFENALELPNSDLLDSDRKALKEELRQAEAKALSERQKLKNYYAILSAPLILHITPSCTCTNSVANRSTEILHVTAD